MNKPSKSQVLYERNMELQKAYAEVSSLTEQRDHWQQQALSKSELVAALEARCRDLEAQLQRARDCFMHTNGGFDVLNVDDLKDVLGFTKETS